MQRAGFQVWGAGSRPETLCSALNRTLPAPMNRRLSRPTWQRPLSLSLIMPSPRLSRRHNARVATTAIRQRCPLFVGAAQLKSNSERLLPRRVLLGTMASGKNPESGQPQEIKTGLKIYTADELSQVVLSHRTKHPREAPLWRSV